LGTGGGSGVDVGVGFGPEGVGVRGGEGVSTGESSLLISGRKSVWGVVEGSGVEVGAVVDSGDCLVGVSVGVLRQPKSVAASVRKRRIVVKRLLSGICIMGAC
jgi:hypothetical protein